MPKYKYRREDYLSPAEVRGMIERARTLRDKALVAFLYIFGTRITEALKLRRERFWKEGNYLVVDVGILKRRKEAGPLKPRHILYARLDTPFMEYLLKHLETVREGERVFPMSRFKAWRIIKELNPNCSPHFFRHTRLWRLARAGATEAELMEWAGWSDTRPAGRYIRATGRLARRLADRID